MILPVDIIRDEILMRLPIKSVVRFRSVCKLWNIITFDPDFAQSHFTRNHNHNDDDDYLIVNTHNIQRTFPDDPYYYISILACNNLSESRINKVPYSRFSKYIHLVGSVNGLVCIACLSQLDYHFILWNPIIRRFKKIFLPERFAKNVLKHFSYMFGFGWDSVENDYKFVGCYTFINSLQSVVYSCKSDSWSEKVVSVDYMFDIFKCETPCTIVKGCPYWICSYGARILKFKVESSEFVLLPEFNVSRRFLIVNLNDCLARVEYNRKAAHPVDVYWFDEVFNVWSKMYTIDLRVNNLSLCFKYGGDIVFDGKKNVYDLKSNKIKSLGCEDDGDVVNGFNYTPSLLFLKGMKPLHGQGPRRSPPAS